MHLYTRTASLNSKRSGTYNQYCSVGSKVKQASHVDVANVAVQIFDDVTMNGSVERRQVAVAASEFLEHGGVGWIHGTREDVNDYVNDENQRHHLYRRNGQGPQPLNTTAAGVA